MRTDLLVATCLMLAACGSDDNASDGASSSGSSSSSSGSTSSSSGGDGGSSGNSSSGGADAGDAGGGDAATDPKNGHATGAPLAIGGQFTVQLQSEPSTTATVYVKELNGTKALGGCTVTLTPAGGAPVTLTSDNPGIPYQKSFLGGWVASYELSVTCAVGSRTGIILDSPSLSTATIAPPPKVNTSSTVTWTPSGEDVKVYILAGTYGTPGGSPLPDNGSFTLPANAFPTSGKTVSVVLQRQRAHVAADLNWTLLVNTHLGPYSVEP